MSSDEENIETWLRWETSSTSSYWWMKTFLLVSVSVKVLVSLGYCDESFWERKLRMHFRWGRFSLFSISLFLCICWSWREGVNFQFWVRFILEGRLFQIWRKITALLIAAKLGLVLNLDNLNLRMQVFQ